MKNKAVFSLLILSALGFGGVRAESIKQEAFAIAIHGGVNGGVVKEGQPASCQKDEIQAEDGPKVKERLAAALNRGYAILDAGGDADEAVVAAIEVMEDSPLFDAGKGSIQTTSGSIEMDAAIMDGTRKAVGAVASVTRLKNPIRAAQALMKAGEDVLMTGVGAEERALALDSELATESPAYFLEHKGCQDAPAKVPPDLARHGTVGAVALDRAGRLVAGTSTGGYPGKKPGRIGDSPIVGAGTYADKRVAMSSSGIGEYFIRHNITHTVAKRMELLGESFDVAVQRTFDGAYADDGLRNVNIDLRHIQADAPDGEALRAILARLHALGIGGVIALDAQGQPHDYFRFSAFARGYRRASDQEPVVRVDGPVDAIR